MPNWLTASVPVWVTQGLLALMFVMIAGMLVALTWAAIRNHFWRHVTRPAVIALAFVCSWGLLELGKRLMLLPLAGTPWYAVLAGTGAIASVINLYGVVCWGVLFYTLYIAYPDSHRGHGEPHDRSSHVS